MQKIYTKNNQLILKNGEDKIDFPLEDVNSVMIENLQTVVSSFTLSVFAKKGILCFICDQNHLPCGVILPFCEHYQTLTQYNNQITLL
jgi:CRISPR-associated protein Cas1